MELLDNAIVCFHMRSRHCYMWICFFAADRNEFPAHRFCILKVARYIYLTEF